MRHAVEKRQDRGIGSDGRRERIRRGGEVIGFAAQKDEIERLAQRVSHDRGRVRQTGVAELAADDKTDLRQLRGAPLAHQERHVAAGFQ